MKHRLLYAVSVLPALLVVPAMADDPITVPKPSHGAAVVWSGVNNQELVGNGQTDNVSYKKNDDGSITVKINGYNKGTFGAFSNYFGRDDRGDFDGDHVGIASFEMKDSTFTSNTGVDQDIVIGSETVHADSAGGAISLWTDGRNPDESKSTCPYGYDDLADTMWPEHKLPTQPPAGTIKNTTFTGNNADKGGAIAFLSSMWFEMPAEYTFTDVTFTGNGIKNYGTDDATVVAAQGGAIYLETSHLTINGESSFTGNAATGKGGAIYVNSKGDETLNLNGASFTSNTAGRGGAIYNDGGALNIDGTEFNANYSTGFVTDDFGGGAIWNKGSAEIKNSAFTNNYSVFDGGAINNVEGATLSLTNTNFTGNYKNDVKSLWSGGAIANSGTITKIDGGTFLNNHTDGTGTYGGAIYVRDSGVISEITGTRFIGNYSLYHGGALATIENAEITLIKNAYFEGNGVKDYDTEDAVAVTQYGGAFKHGGNHETEIQNSTFINNMATLRGGAIINEASALVNINNNSIFTSNKAEQSGGALYGNFEISDSKFSLNSAVMSGGAMSGYGKISNSVFSENVAGQEGGALVVSSGSMELDNVTFDKNYVNDTYTDKGAPDWHRGGGAIYSQNGLTVKNSSFDGNYAGGVGGAISSWWGGASLTVTNTEFKNNYSSYAYGGAIFNSEKVTSLTTDSGKSFSNNTAVAGGAIANMSRYSDAKGKVVTIDSIDGYTFENNHAIANDKALVRVPSGDDAGKFENASDEYRGHVDGMGGAIYNEKVITSMSNVTFTGNTATDFGGAIYNANGASITMSGTNEFTNNTAKGVANDIHNDGTLTIAGGETTLTGGMTGNGTFILADGATLNLGNASISQSVLTLNGTLNATINSATDYAQLLGDVAFSDTSVFNLTVSAVGTYKMFSSVTGDIEINAGDWFDAVSTADGIVVTTKSATEIAENTGLSEDDAGTLVNIANATSDALKEISVAAQQELIAGNVEHVAAEMKKLNPTDQPIVQAVTKSVQNEVLNLVASRMATISGRAGGDVALTGGGVWAQGLFNKSKLNNVFHGYTRGVAAGIDEVIEHDFTLGLGYAYGNTDVHVNNGRSNDITSNTLFLYAQYKPSDWFINATAHYTTAEYKESTSVIGYSKDSAHDVDSFGGSITAGYAFASGATPELGLRYLNITQDDYVDSFGIKVSADTVQTLTSVAGVKYVFDIDVTRNWVVRPELRAAATYDIISDKDLSTVVMPGTAAYVVNGDRLSRVGGEFGIGLSTMYCGVELSVNYDLNIHKDYTSQTGMIKARYEF